MPSTESMVHIPGPASNKGTRPQRETSCTTTAPGQVHHLPKHSTKRDVVFSLLYSAGIETGSLLRVEGSGIKKSCKHA